MSLRLIKEHLPWFAPSTAIVLAATGVIDFSPRDTTEAAASVSAAVVAPEVTRTVTQNPVAVGQQSAGIAPLDSAAVVQPQADPVPQLLQQSEPSVVQPAVVTPQPDPVQPLAPQKVSVNPNTEISPTSDRVRSLGPHRRNWRRIGPASKTFGFWHRTPVSISQAVA